MAGREENASEAGCARITVVLASWHSADLIAKLIVNLREKAMRPDSVIFFVLDNTNGADEAIEAVCRNEAATALHRLDSGALVSSRGHAFALNYAMGRLTTPYALVIDPDVHVFKSQWDVFLIEKLEAAGAIAIGAPYPFWKLGKYHDFPSPVFMFFNTHRLRQLAPDWTPFPDSWLTNKRNFIARQVVRMGFVGTRGRLSARPRLARFARLLESFFGVCGPDTGYLLARNARRRGLKAVLFNEVTENSVLLERFAGTASAQDLAREFELYYCEGDPMMAHKYSTRSYFWRTLRGDDPDYWRKCIHGVEAALGRNAPTVGGLS